MQSVIVFQSKSSMIDQDGCRCDRILGTVRPDHPPLSTALVSFGSPAPTHPKQRNIPFRSIIKSFNPFPSAKTAFLPLDGSMPQIPDDRTQRFLSKIDGIVAIYQLFSIYVRPLHLDALPFARPFRGFVLSL
jgi:hypothetical protein